MLLFLLATRTQESMVAGTGEVRGTGTNVNPVLTLFTPKPINDLVHLDGWLCVPTDTTVVCLVKLLLPSIFLPFLLGKMGPDGPFHLS